MSAAVDPVVAFAVRAGLALLFGAAALHKLRGFVRFRATLAAYRLLPPSLVRAGAAGVIAAETAVVAAVAVPATARAGLCAAAAMLAAYAAAIAVNLLRGRTAIDCGCLGAAGREAISWWLVGRNAAVATVALAGLLPSATRPLAWIDVVTGAATVAFAAVVWLGVDALLANAPAMRRARVAA